MKKLFLFWIFSCSMVGMCQDIIKREVPDTLRATLLVTYNGANMSIAHTKPGYVVRIDGHDKEFLDDRKKRIKAPVEVWNYKIR